MVFACFLPDESRQYIGDEIAQTILGALGDGTPVYCGVQHGSDPATEEWLREAAPGLQWRFARVTAELHIDSDASAFVAALGLLRDSGTTPDRCYFVHTKGATSGEDDLRRELLADLFGADAARCLSRPGVGSYGPRLTISRSEEDRRLMVSWLDRFAPGHLPAMPYFYAYTMWVARGRPVMRFLKSVDESWFTTPVLHYSDRWFAERDLPHLVDAVTLRRPSFGRLVGSHSTGWARPRQREFYRELARWVARAAAARVPRPIR